jgi:hypothetical protein
MLGCRRNTYVHYNTFRLHSSSADSRHTEDELQRSEGGGEEIRTLGPVSETPVFKTGAIDHSATPPYYYPT